MHLIIRGMNIFTYYFQRARHLSVYQYQYLNNLPVGLIFPYVTNLTMIDCSSLGISNLLYSHRFPKLEQIVYLSGHPGAYDIHTRFPKSVKWIFPNRDYSFYNCMLDAGFGIKNNTVITENIYSASVKNGIPSFDIHIPGYGRRDGSIYKEHMYHYFHHPEVLSTLSNNELIPANQFDNTRYLNYIKTHANSAFHQYERHCLEQDFINHILKDA